MGQEDILRVLKKEKILTAKELAEELGVSYESIVKALNRMINNDVDRMIISNHYSSVSYAWKITGCKISKEKLEKYHIIENEHQGNIN